MTDASPARPGRREELGVLIGILLAVAAIYAPVAGHDWLREGDRAWIVENPRMALPFGVEAIWRHATEPVDGHWAPLSAVSLHATAALGEGSPAVTLLTNAALHALAAAVLFRLLLAATSAFAASAFVALLFAVHPLQVESVAWATQRQTVQGGLFVLLGMAAYARSASAAPRLGRAGGWLLLGMLSKPTLAVAPLGLLLLDLWPLRRFGTDEKDMDGAALRRCVVEKLPLLAVGAGVAAVAWWLHVGTIAEPDRLPLVARVTASLNAMLVHLSQAVLPQALAMPQPPPAPDPAGALGAVVLVAGISAVVWGFRGERPYLVFGWLWFALFLLPMLGLVPIDTAAYADRSLYLPLIGLGVAFAWGAIQVVDELPSSRPAVIVAALLVLGWFGIVASQQVRVWSGSESLYAHALQTTGSNPRARLGLAETLIEAGRPEEALLHLALVTQAKTGWIDAELASADALAAIGQGEAAILVYAHWAKVEPERLRPVRSLALALVSAGRDAEALPQLEAALSLAPEDPELRRALERTRATSD